MINKRLKNIVEKLVINSFTPKGEVKESLVIENTKLLKKLPFGQAIAALTLYQKGLKREILKTTLEIISSTALSPSQKKQIMKISKKTFNINKVLTKIDPLLLGGLRIKVGDMVFDDSVQNKIGQLKGVING